MSSWIDKKGRRHVGIMVGGKRIHRKLQEGATARDAKLVEAEIRASAARAPQQVRIPGDPSMAAVLALYVEHAKSLRSAETSTYHAMRLGPWAEKYKASQAQEFAGHVIRDMRDAYAHATINRSLACAKKGLTIAWKQRLTPENYGLRIESMPVNNKREVFLSVDQVRSIAQYCSEEAQAAIWAALLTGARRGEIFQIRAEHIGPDTITLPSSHTKTLRTRVVPIIPALRPWLVFFPLTMTIDGVKSSWRRARVKAGMDHVNFHDLRHSCASIMLSLGVDLYTISKILGHSNVQTTQRYAHLQVGAQRAALGKLSDLVQETQPKRRAK
jgi:site-specific recombinase XerD